MYKYIHVNRKEKIVIFLYEIHVTSEIFNTFIQILIKTNDYGTFTLRRQ